MAVSKEILKRTLNLVLDNGVDEEGKAVYKTYSFSSIKPGAAVDKVLEAGQALAALYSNTLSDVQVTEKAQLAAE